MPFASQVLTLVLVICTTAIHLWLLTTRRFGLDFRQALATPQGTGSAVAFSMSILVVWPVTALLVYHARVSAPTTDVLGFFSDRRLTPRLQLLLLNITTIEQVSAGGAAAT